MSSNSSSSPTVNGEAIEPGEVIGAESSPEQHRDEQPASPQTGKRQREVASDRSPGRATRDGTPDNEPASKKARVTNYGDTKETDAPSHDASAQDELREEGPGHGRHQDDRNSRASPRSREGSRDRNRLTGEGQERRGRRDPWDQRDQAYDRDRRHPAATGPDTRDLPSRRKAGVSQEERKRGQRLFGGLLSTLGQPSSRLPPHARRRADQQQQQRQERQQQERQSQQEEKQEQKEDRKQQAERLAELAKTRQIQQIQFDERTMNARHANMRSLAHSLQTKSEPKLYYLPWELSREQQDIIDDQVQAVEEKIEREKDEFAREKQERLAALGVVASAPAEAKTDEPAAAREDPSDEQPAPPSPAPPVGEEGKQGQDQAQDQDQTAAQAPAHETEAEGPDHRDEHRHRHDHDEKDIMVETEEDTVLY